MKKIGVTFLLLVVTCAGFSQQKNIYLCNAGEQYHFDFNSSPDSTTYYMNFPAAGSNIWQVGKTNKPYFTSGGIGNLRGLMTDTLNVYPTTSSSFEFTVSECFPFNNNGIRMVLQYRMDSDSLVDGLLIEVSHDGQTWNNAANLGGTYFAHTSQVLSLGGQNGMSGLHAGGFDMEFGNFQDTLTVRFTFASDGIQNNRSGCRIDWILVEATNPIGINPNTGIPLLTVYPNPAQDKINITTGADPCDLEMIDPYGKKFTA